MHKQSNTVNEMLSMKMHMWYSLYWLQPLCTFHSLFLPLDLHFGAEDTWESNLAELLQISAKF